MIVVDSPRVHPHARGDNQDWRWNAKLLTGPSPRAWGQLPGNHALRPERRSIPTRVGTTTKAAAPPGCRPVHPHARGDNAYLRAAMLNAIGPSPRAWGQRPVGTRGRAVDRSIPTRVGTTPGRARTCGTSAVHPHARGDNHLLTLWAWIVRRPSPRAWGQRPSARGSRCSARSIPTRVGTTSSGGVSYGAWSVHPHARGDNVCLIGLRSGSFGPSPRAWGQPGIRDVRRVLGRSIPTRVGTTRCRPGGAAGIAVHPHARGDNDYDDEKTDGMFGPSPRAWGQPHPVFPWFLDVRSIPTRVGTTSRMCHTGALVSVHPHARGDNQPPHAVGVGLGGPSPRAWGQRQGHGHRHDAPRSIPTRVGTTRSGSACATRSSVHLHARGDNAPGPPNDTREDGPSPRAWGQLSLVAILIIGIRSIPTRVGTTTTARL